MPFVFRKKITNSESEWVFTCNSSDSPELDHVSFVLNISKSCFTASKAPGLVPFVDSSCFMSLIDDESGLNLLGIKKITPAYSSRQVQEDLFK